jgi:hypothetical protein
MKRATLATLLAVPVLAYSGAAMGQELQATINGSVLDKSGAAVAGVTVVFHRNDTNTDERTVLSDAHGSYVATNLPPATYTVSFRGTGFKEYTAQNVTVYVSQKLTLNAALQPGEVTESVVVEADPVTIQTESAAQSATVTGEQVRELELNNRNFQQLVTLQPGVVNNLGDSPGYGLNSTTDVSVNGVRGTANNWTVDGADINDSGSNGTLLNIPSVDAIQEFTLQRSQYDASFGRSAGGQVLVATKSGTHAFHGDVYEFVRNDILNANSYFNKQVPIPRGVERYNNFGFTLGGPVYIPKLFNTHKDKLFFFWSEEWRKVSSPTPVNIPAATTAMLGGLVTDQVTGAPAGCTTPAAGGATQINPNCFSANAKLYISNVLSKFPANNGSTYVASYSALNNFRQDIVRIDYPITSKLRFFARYMKDTLPSNQPTGLWGGANFPGVVNVGLQVPGTNAVGNITYVISSKMVNEFEFAYSEGNILATLNGPANDPALTGQFTGTLAYKDAYGRLPSVSIPGVTVVSEGSAPYHEQNLDRNIFDNFSWTLGKHTLRFGATAQWMMKSENASNGAASFTFASYSDFLLGNVAAYAQANRDIIPDLRYTNLEAYVQDDWKATSRLSVNVGVRYSYFPSPTDPANTLSNFVPSLYLSTSAPTLDPSSGNFVSTGTLKPSTYANGLIFPGGSSCTQAQAISAQVQCSPFGSQVNPGANANSAPRIGFSFDVFGNQKTVVRSGYGIFYDRTLNGMWEQNAFTNPPLVQSTNVQNGKFDQPLGGTLTTSTGPNALEMTGDTTAKLDVPSYQTFNLSVQDQLTPSTVLEVAYVGSAGRHLLGEIDRNQPTLAAREANPTANVNLVRPYVGYAYIKDRLTNFSSNYNALQVSLNHRTRSGLTLGASYTYSKTLADSVSDRDTASNNSYDLHSSYGPTTYNQPHIFVANYVYTLPFYRSQQGFAGHILGGWEVSGITTFVSGMSNTITQALDPFACTANEAGTACATGSAPNTYFGGLGMGTLNGSVQVRVDQVAKTHYPKTITQWFNQSSFVAASGHFGSSSVGSVYGPGQENWDIGAMKNVKFLDRYSLQIRGEFFNAFNHTNPSAIDTSINDTNFGQVTATHTPRTIQIGMKLYY